MGNRAELVESLSSVNMDRRSRNNVIKDTPARIVFKIFNYLILAAIGIVCLLPLWHIFMLSFSNPNMIIKAQGLVLWPLSGTHQVLAENGTLITENWNATLAGYQIVLKNSALIRGYGNTIFYVGAGCALSIAFGAIGAYCVSRRAIFAPYIIIMMMFTMFFQGGMIPTYMVNKNLGLVDTRWVIVMNGMISFMNIIILMMAFRNLPDGLMESAQLDGAGHFTILFRIALPLVKASIAVIALFYAIGKWQDYFTAQLYLKSDKLQPLQIVLRQILLDATTPPGMDGDINVILGSQGNNRELIEYATTMVGVIPLLCMYPFIQKYFVKGIMIGSIKG